MIISWKTYLKNNKNSEIFDNALEYEQIKRVGKLNDLPYDWFISVWLPGISGEKLPRTIEFIDSKFQLPPRSSRIIERSEGEIFSVTRDNIIDLCDAMFYISGDKIFVIDDESVSLRKTCYDKEYPNYPSRLSSYIYFGRRRIPTPGIIKQYRWWELTDYGNKDWPIFKLKMI